MSNDIYKPGTLATVTFSSLNLWRICDSAYPNKENTNPYSDENQGLQYTSHHLYKDEIVMLLAVEEKGVKGTKYLQLLTEDLVGWIYLDNHLWNGMVEAFQRCTMDKE